LLDNTRYFLDKIEEIHFNGYMPSNQDILHSRQKTTGIINENLKNNTKISKEYNNSVEFVNEDIIYNIFDVGKF
jgi:hypothetical protein